MTYLRTLTLAALLAAASIGTAGAAEVDADLVAELSEGYTGTTILVLIAAAAVCGLAAWNKRRAATAPTRVRELAVDPDEPRLDAV